MAVGLGIMPEEAARNATPGINNSRAMPESRTRSTPSSLRRTHVWLEVLRTASTFAKP